MRARDNNDTWHQEKTYESMITYGVNAIKFVLIANGGAILAILTFLGNHADKVASVKPGLLFYILGVVLGGTVNITAYLTQICLFNEREELAGFWSRHQTWLYFSLGLVALGIISFALGSYLSISALQK